MVIPEFSFKDSFALLEGELFEAVVELEFHVGQPFELIEESFVQLSSVDGSDELGSQKI